MLSNCLVPAFVHMQYSYRISNCSTSQKQKIETKIGPGQRGPPSPIGTLGTDEEHLYFGVCAFFTHLPYANLRAAEYASLWAVAAYSSVAYTKTSATQTTFVKRMAMNPSRTHKNICVGVVKQEIEGGARGTN